MAGRLAWRENLGKLKVAGDHAAVKSGTGMSRLQLVMHENFATSRVAMKGGGGLGYDASWQAL